MTQLKIQQFSTASTTAVGITIACPHSKSGVFFRLGVSLKAQEKFFGKKIDPSKDRFQITIDDDPKTRTYADLMLIEKTDVADAVPPQSAAFNGVALKLVPWVTPPSEPIKAQVMPVIHFEPGLSVRFTLPEWARPKLKKIGEGQSLLDELPIRK